MVYVLTYDFPHKKTQYLLFKLKLKDYNVTVIGTPWVERKNFTQNSDQYPKSFPPKIEILLGIIKDGRNIIQTKTTPL